MAGSTRVVAADEERGRKQQGHRAHPQSPRKAAETAESGSDDTFQPLFNDDLVAIEHRIAEPKHHRRLFQELSQKWREVFASCEDLPTQPSASTIDAWVIMAWGGRRYCVIAQPAAEQTAAWLSEMEAMICSRLISTP